MEAFISLTETQRTQRVAGEKFVALADTETPEEQTWMNKACRGGHGNAELYVPPGREAAVWEGRRVRGRTGRGDIAVLPAPLRPSPAGKPEAAHGAVSAFSVISSEPFDRLRASGREKNDISTVSPAFPMLHVQ